ncbi:MAG: hypothetical protein LBL70_02565 [Treponema sp.]|nr:hypothetical protein [Treponema sp.]
MEKAVKGPFVPLKLKRFFQNFSLERTAGVCHRRRRMNKLGIVLAVLVLGTSGCASTQYYANLAKEHDFEYYFPAHSFRRTFSSVEEAYDFVKTAQAKFTSSVDKSLAKGLVAKLTGPAPEQDKPVSIGCFMQANTGSSIDLSKIEEPLELVLRNANSATIVFLVFYGDRGVSIPSYYLKQGFVYTSGNSQIQSFRSFGNRYEAQYPIGWTTEKAFRYLRKEID